jgi:hypothetical protein
MTCSVCAALSMLSCAVRAMSRYHRGQSRRAMPQLNLNFTDIPIPETCLWEQFDDQQKKTVVETLSRLLVKATRDQQQEQTDD